MDSHLSLFAEGLWNVEPPLDAGHEELLRRVLQEQGIDNSELAAGDAAVSTCLDIASRAHVFAQQAHKLATEATAATAALPPPTATATSALDDAAHAAAADLEALATASLVRLPLPHQQQVPPATNTSGDADASTPTHSKRKRPSPSTTAHASVANPSTAQPLLSLSAAGQSDVPQGLAALADSATGDPSASSKGLKHFSLKVAEKVEGLACTNYNQVADDLVAEMAADAQAGLLEGNFDEKNVRRRVYDALNVLEALGMIDKGKKDIHWRGWPPSLGQTPTERLSTELTKLAVRVEHKSALVGETATKALCLSNLAMRNGDAPLPVLTAAQEQGLPAPNPLSLPFMLVHAPADAEIEVNISSDQRTAELDFHQWPFQIYDDARIMRLMGLGEPRPELATSSLHAQAAAAMMMTVDGSNMHLPSSNAINEHELGQQQHQQQVPQHVLHQEDAGGAGGDDDKTTPQKPGVGAAAGGASGGNVPLLSPSAGVSAMELTSPNDKK